MDTKNKKITLILGGARSGKSSYAQKIAMLMSPNVLFIATAEAKDKEMEFRIQSHREKRPTHWRTLEVPQNIGEALILLTNRADVYLLDCFTLFATNIITNLSEPLTDESAESAINSELNRLFETIEEVGGNWIIVSNEVGLGLVPPNYLGRIFRDVLGKANQRLATKADEVFFMISGLPMMLKG